VTVETAERDFGYVYREDGIFHVFVAVDPETGDKEKTREERVTGDLELALARDAVPAEARDTFAQLLKELGDPALASYQARYPDHAERAAAYQAAVDAELERRTELAAEGIEL
jgi:hypothetical protein